jgi:hypothetical protein
MMDGATHQGNHVHHGRIAGHKQQECHLHGVGHVEVALLDLLRHQLADQVVLGLLVALVGEFSEVAEELTVKHQMLGSDPDDLLRLTYSAAEDASRAVALPLVRIEFCCVRNSRSSKGTPRMV